jgi:pyrroloquinoline-quinone synthase
MISHQVFEDAISENIRRVRSHTFLQKCAQGKTPLSELKMYLLQNAKYSIHFTRYLCAVMSNLATNEDVLHLAENLFEELGFGLEISTPHHILYKNMMDAINVFGDGASIYPQTQQLVDTMFSHCRNPNPSYGLGAICLGAEALVPAMYQDIMSGFLACGIEMADLEFFRIHISCDDGHAQTLRRIMLERALADELEAEVMIASGADLVRARLHFFSAIETGAAA